ncbi:sigma 54-interacting transcriptional regulator [Moorella sulfitireducens]|uniref:sigma 54-interacting transcriptional regulator n=1 Tax=Neomoorella sulfitireducens TaxID=2972948 RepID=UPI0021ACC543|nr:sigma 54-interacting transcriptional regulator [Moorella sulfitireducens]
MGKFDIGILAPYPEFFALSEEIARKWGLRARIESPPIARVVETAKAWEKEGEIQVIIARTPGAKVLSRHELALPVVRVDFTSFDVIQALYRAAQLSGKVAVFDAGTYVQNFDYELMSRMLKFDFQVFVCRNERQALEKLKEARDSEIELVVCLEAFIAEMAQAQGFRAILVQCQRETIEEAFRQAIEIIDIKRSDKRRELQLTTILNGIQDGVIAVNDKELVTVFNPAAEKILGVKAAAILGKPIKDFLVVNPIRHIYGDGKEVKSEIIEVNQNHVVVWRRPLLVEEENVGLVVTFQQAERVKRIEEKIRRELHAKGLVAKFGFEDIKGRSAAIKKTIKEARNYARSEGTVLIVGETGVGKELFAHAIHKESVRRTGPFVAINCSAVPETLLESELFGYDEGAFTGAKKGGKVGLFELAHGGTIFLDEIGELSTQLQTRLLRVLQEKEIMRVGGNHVIPIDVRVIAATNRDLEEAVRKGSFRQDLFYRLNILRLRVPPLRERKEDIAILFDFFMEKLSISSTSERAGVPACLLAEMGKYDWPGNVRELQGFVERYLALGETNSRKWSVLRSLIAEMVNGAGQEDSQQKIIIELDTLERMENQLLSQAYSNFHGNKSELAKVLGVSRATLWKKLKKVNLDSNA